MQITREDLNRCTVRLAVVCDTETVKAGFDRAKKQLSKKVRLPGFRPGHAPRHLVEPYLDQSAVGELALETIVGGAYKQAVTEQQLVLDSTVSPQIEVTKIDEAECEFTAKLGLPPVIELGDYTDLPVDRPVVEITDADIDRQLDDLRRHKGTRVAITDRGVEEGDVAVVNIRLDGQEGEGRNFMTIAGQTFPSLDDLLKGMRVEEVKHGELTFPATFKEADWAGKTHTAMITLNSVSATHLPELDDAFAQTLKTDSVEDLREKIKQGMEAAVAGEVEKIVAGQLLDRVLERSTVEVSDNMWEPIADQRLREVAEEQVKQGSSIEAYVQKNGMTVETLRDEWREKSKLEVKRAVVVGEIFKKEGMKLQDEDLNTELMHMAREYGQTPEEMLAMLKKANALQELRIRAVTSRVNQFLASKAKVKELATSPA